jgi:hypothetical protein
MNLDLVPIWVVFVGTVLLVMVFIEVGYRLGGMAHRKSVDEKETPVSGVSATVLGLTAFILAFSFSIVTERYDARKALVRDDADAIRTAYLRARFLPAPDRAESERLLTDYVQARLHLTSGSTVGHEELSQSLASAESIHRRLWDIAVVNAERDMNSDVAALYIEALNQVMDVHASRLAIGVRMRLPFGIWVVLYSLTMLGMVSMGYHAGIADSKRSNATWVLAVSFAMVITLIAALDRPWGVAMVTQQPLVDLEQFMRSGP